MLFLISITTNIALSAQKKEDCDYTNADKYDGWGWDPVRKLSCPPREIDDEESKDTDDDPDAEQACDFSHAEDHGGW